MQVCKNVLSFEMVIITSMLCILFTKCLFGDIGFFMASLTASAILVWLAGVRNKENMRMLKAVSKLFKKFAIYITPTNTKYLFSIFKNIWLFCCFIICCAPMSSIL